MTVLPTTMQPPPQPQPPPPPPTAPRLPPVAALRPAPAATSLWRELSDGSAPWGVRLAANLAAGVFLAGAVAIGAYVLAALFPPFNRASRWASGSGPRGVYPTDELVVGLTALAAAAFLAASVWLWTRQTRRRAVWRPTLYTIAVVVVTGLLCAWADDALRGDSEFVICGVLLLGTSALLLVWLQAVRGGALRRSRPLHDPQDGLPDVRCPACDYRMVGLTESRCPECGTAYTLDELLARQRFDRPAEAQRR